jgi:hypothetical protein
MNAAEITALCTGIPTVLAALGALYASVRAKGSADTAASHAATVRGLVEAQAYSINKPAENFPAPPSNQPL